MASIPSQTESITSIGGKNVDTLPRRPNTNWKDGSCLKLKCELTVNPCYPLNQSAQMKTEHIICDKCPTGSIRPPANDKECCPPCEPGPSSGNCLLNKGKFDYIKTKENCTSRIKYQHNTCRGTCESTSTSTYGETGLDSFCTCCQPSVGKLWTATLDCPNNEVRSTNFFEIRACRCRQFKCVSEQDKSGMEEINEKGQVVNINQQSVGRRRRR
nr:mucin-2-like [Pocillopora verrucosa]